MPHATVLQGFRAVSAAAPAFTIVSAVVWTKAAAETVTAGAPAAASVSDIRTQIDFHSIQFCFNGHAQIEKCKQFIRFLFQNFKVTLAHECNAGQSGRGSVLSLLD